VISNSLLLHPLALLKHLHTLNQPPISTHNLPISNPPQLILPYHLPQHQYQQPPPPDNKIPTTKKPIPPPYLHKPQPIPIPIPHLLQKHTFQTPLKQNIQI
ncbi:adenylosuccinate synthetase, partial [Staphylococcus hominis]|uniref:adenylosuccinate synthetase n=1 Tax=Staphylococcus hominis TaxID=1290 RepID=UPI001643B8B8